MSPMASRCEGAGADDRRPRPVTPRGVWLTLALLAACERDPRSPVAARDAARAPSPRDAAAPTLTRAESNGRWGFVDARGAWVIPATFAWAETFSEGVAAVKVGERWGFVDRRGQSVVAPRYRDADGFSEGLAAVLDDDGWRYIDASGAVRVRGPFESARPFHCGAARVQRARVYLLGQRSHGTYETLDGDYPRQTHARSDLFEALARPAAPATPPDGLDDVALDILFADADVAADLGTNHRWDQAPRRLREPQWDEHVWQTIRRTGEVIAPSEVAPCAGEPATPASVPPDLRATLEGLHLARDRMPFFRQVVALGARAVPVIVPVLSDPRKPVRLNALETLVRLGPPAAAAVPALTAALDDPDGDVCVLAAWALGRIGAPAAASVPALLRAHERHARLIDAVLLAIAPGDPAVRAALERSAARRTQRAPLADVRRRAEHHDPTVVPALVALLGSPRVDEALSLLADLGPLARQALPPVRARLQSVASPVEDAVEDGDTPRCQTFSLAARAAWRISDDAALVLPDLEQQLRRPGNGSYFRRCDPWALRLLAEMGPAAVAAAPSLRRYARQNAEAAPAVQSVLRTLGAPP